MTLSSVTITGNSSGAGGNTSGDGGGAGGNGAGVYTSGAATVTASQVLSNTTGGGGSAGYGANGGPGGSGGGLYNAGTLTLSGSTVAGNATGRGGTGGDQATRSTYGGPSGNGAGLANTTVLTLTSSQVLSNTAGTGGNGGNAPGFGGNGGSGGGVDTSGTLTLTESTIVANSTGPGGPDTGPGDTGGNGGNGGGLNTTSTLTLSSSSVLSNSTGAGGAGFITNGVGGSGGGLYRAAGTASVADTLVAGDTISSGGSGQGIGCTGAITSQDYNLFQTTSGCSITEPSPSHDLTGQTPLLGPLQNYGGPTPSVALLAGGPGADYIPALQCGPITDQRGFPRPDENEGVCDIGAVEAGALSTGSGAQAQSGTVPWHPHATVHLSDRLALSIDEADGHIDLSASDMSLPALGPSLSLDHVWDSTRAQAGVTTAAGQGWQTQFTARMGGVLTGTVVVTDATGAVWPFVYTGTLPASAPYTAYAPPAGFPWTLTVVPTTTAGTPVYTLTNLLDGAVQTFDTHGGVLSTADSYGNSNTVALNGGGNPISLTTSGGRALSLTYLSGLLTAVRSPLWLSGGAGAAGSQRVLYGYGGLGGSQLLTVTWGAGTPDALRATYGYSGTQLVTVSTPAGHTWTLGYDTLGRLSSLTSPAQGTPGQAGSTPAYTTSFNYSAGQTVRVEGAGTSAALTTTYTLDALGEATAVADGLGDTSYTTYDADHDVLTSTDANGHTTATTYAYVGPGGSTGLISATVRPGVLLDCITPGCGGTTPVVITNSYTLANDLGSTMSGNQALSSYAYDGHHSVLTMTQQLFDNGPACRPHLPCAPVHPAPGPHLGRAVGPQPFTTIDGSGIGRRGTVTLYDAAGEITATIDGRGVVASGDGVAALSTTPPASQYTRSYSYTQQGDLLTESTPPLTTTAVGGALLANVPVTTTYSYDLDGNRVSMTSANGYPTTYSYDHLGRLVQTQQYTATLYDGTVTQPQETTAYDGDGNVIRAVDGNGDVTLTSYDPLGRVISTTNPVGATTLYTYTATEKQAEQDAAGNVTSYGYDAAGRLLTITDPLLGTTVEQYDAVGNTTVITSPGGSPIEVKGYDALNEVITDTVEGPLTTTQYGYDLDGNVVQEQAPNGDVTYSSYDGADRLVQVELVPVNEQQTPSAVTYAAFSYDDADNPLITTDFAGRTTVTTFDGDNRALTSTATLTGGLTLTTTQQYDPDGNLL